MHATLNSKHINGSPFPLNIGTGNAYPRNCSLLSFDATTPLPTGVDYPPLPTALPPLATGHELSVLVETRDVSNKRLAHGGEHIKAWLRPADDPGPAALTAAAKSRSGLLPPSLTITDQANGLYTTLAYTSPGGTIEVHAGRAGVQPVGQRLTRAAHDCSGQPSCRFYRGARPDLQGVRAGEAAHFFSCSRRMATCKFMARVSRCTRRHDQAVLNADREIACDLRDNGDGTYAGGAGEPCGRLQSEHQPRTMCRLGRRLRYRSVHRQPTRRTASSTSLTIRLARRSLAALPAARASLAAASIGSIRLAHRINYHQAVGRTANPCLGFSLRLETRLRWS